MTFIKLLAENTCQLTQNIIPAYYDYHDGKFKRVDHLNISSVDIALTMYHFI